MTVADRAAAVVARWVAYYTRRLPAEVAGRRRAELASDLWEQRAEGSAPGRTALSMLWRMAAGALSDLTWRREQLALARRRAGEPAGRTGWAALASGWWLGVAAMVGVAEIVWGVGAVAAETAIPGAVGHGLAASAGGLVVLGGLATRRRARVAGDLVIAVGALPAVRWLGTSGAVLLTLAALVVIVAATLDLAAITAARRGRRLDGEDRMLLGNAVAFLAVLVGSAAIGLGSFGAGGLVIVAIGALSYLLRRRRST